MKWNTNRFTKGSAALGDTRSIKKFLLFPKNMSGATKWLEYVYLHQKVVSYESRLTYNRHLKWVDVSWANSEAEFIERL